MEGILSSTALHIFCFYVLTSTSITSNPVFYQGELNSRQSNVFIIANSRTRPSLLILNNYLMCGMCLMFVGSSNLAVKHDLHHKLSVIYKYVQGNSSVIDLTFSATYSQTLSSTALVRYIEKTLNMGQRVG